MWSTQKSIVSSPLQHLHGKKRQHWKEPWYYSFPLLFPKKREKVYKKEERTCSKKSCSIRARARVSIFIYIYFVIIFFYCAFSFCCNVYWDFLDLIELMLTLHWRLAHLSLPVVLFVNVPAIPTDFDANKLHFTLGRMFFIH